MAEQRYRASRGIIEAAYQIDQGRFAAAGTADHTDRLAGLGRKTDIGQTGGTGAVVGESYVVKRHSWGSRVCIQLCGGRVRHRGMRVQNFVHAHAAGQGAGHRDDQVRQAQQVGQDLGHIVDKRDDLTLGQGTVIDLVAAAQQQGNDGQVDDQVGQGIHQRRDAACHRLDAAQVVVSLHKGSQFICLAGEGPHHTGAHIVFTGQQGDLIQTILGLVVDGHRGAHDEINNQRNNNRCCNKQQGQPRADGVRHDQRTDHDERAAQQQAQRQVDTVLHLVDVAGHAGDQRRGADAVQFAVAQRVDMAEQVLAQCSAKAQRRLGGEVLGRQAAGQADGRQQHQQTTALPDEHSIAIFDAGVDNARHHQWHEKFKGSFQHFKQGCQNSLLFVALDVAHQFVHVVSPHTRILQTFLL